MLAYKRPVNFKSHGMRGFFYAEYERDGCPLMTETLAVKCLKIMLTPCKKKAAQAACKRKTTACEPWFCGVCAAYLQAA